MKHLHKITNPFFMLSVLALIVNDLFCKAAFHNDITGKVSDFAGLFAFPFLWSILFPRYAKGIHISTAFFFLWWKSGYSQPCIDLLHAWSFPIYRVVDSSDNIALISILFSYHACKQKAFRWQSPVLKLSILVLSCLSFMGTSIGVSVLQKVLLKADNLNKEYRYNFSKQELIYRLNMIQLEFLSELDTKVDFNSNNNSFYHVTKGDTLAVLLDYEKVRDTDTIRLRSNYAEIQIAGNTTSSVLRLLSFYHRFGIRNKESDNDAIELFEKEIEKKIRKY